jgi:hypothetical protein
MRAPNSKIVLSNEGIRILKRGITPALSNYLGETGGSSQRRQPLRSFPEVDRFGGHTVERAIRTLRDTAVSLSPSPSLSRSTSLIRRIATFGLGISPRPRTEIRCRFAPIFAV